MIKKRLLCHPAQTHPELKSFAVSVNFKMSGDLNLHYELCGDLDRLLIPKICPAARVDKLWEHMCFEAFIAVEGETAYSEYNFSPSTQWAAYAFSDYRVARDWRINASPKLEIIQMPKRLTLTAQLVAEILPPNPQNLPLQLGLSAVLETQDGQLSYWALKHPLAQPDFHHRGAFNVTVKHTSLT